ncbi:CBS domain-containing protein [Streptomyces sp. TP-A0874]|uniref:CBS domain-containing protein n=1 Tax=Streptomyces sp. TP-A0874 TaxID=549819 RepID=UPI0008529C8F|nr:CBS domain-containing protein [Streptomyces sp. TP-A0874]
MAQYVREVMTPAVTAVRPDASVVEAAEMMREQDLGDVLVMQDDGQLLGVLTDRDITLRAIAEGVDPLAVTAEAVCTPDPITISDDDSVSTAISLMRAYAIRRLPVTRDGRTTGVVTIGDLAEEQDPRSALADISRAAPDSWPEPPATA